MTNAQALDFIRDYFDELFVKHNVDALDVYLHPDYSDDDIGPGEADPIQNSKNFLRDWFEKEPTIRVAVKDAMVQDDVITAFLEWYRTEKGVRQTIQKGVAIFVVKDRQILKRHTFIYFET
ncbi:protein containg SnoaL-like domain [Longilinea arvoryzae]|uniref:Protein containg SnoaL-like domain n=1 Tax=Longilinea arvoryzae TaxID=360412 RepID=A0A0S7BE55_9CHLR|nr:nuclear transport factor 2 family protein [Longilinea arvoryzae]GAP12678.1 protein containg SnoaL-like domain [Longilinea arvoryzae]